jgi:hypothetical protein
MRTRGKVLLIVAALAAAALIGVLSRSSEPCYEGRRLSSWIIAFDGMHRQEEVEKAEAAVSSIGTSALPCLLVWIRFEPSAHPLRQNLVRALERHVNSSALYFLLIGKREHLSMCVLSSFYFLGARATPAIPELARLLDDPSAPETATRAAFALAQVGTNSLPALLKVIDTPGHRRRSQAVLAMRVLIERSPESFGEAGVPELIRCLGDPSDPLVVSAAATTLAHFKSVPRVVPTLTSCLTSNKSSLRCSAARALGNLGALAAPALPALTNALLHPDPNLRSDAKDAIRQITRDARTNAPPKQVSL